MLQIVPLDLKQVEVIKGASSMLYGGGAIAGLVNFENFLDTRQTRFDTIYTGSITNPTFRDIYAPVGGFVINGGIKLKL